MSLQSFGKEIRFHILCGLVNNLGNFSIANSVCDVEIMYVDMFGMFAARSPAIPFQLDSAGVVLLNNSLIANKFQNRIRMEVLCLFLKKILIHIINVIASSVPKSSALVEILVFIFCLHDKDIMLPCPRVSDDPV